MTTRAASLFFGAVGVLTFVAPEDLTLVGFSFIGIGALATVVASSEPDLLAASTYGSTHITYGCVAGASCLQTAPVYTPLSWPMGVGDSLYFSADSAAMVWLYWTPQLN